MPSLVRWSAPASPTVPGGECYGERARAKPADASAAPMALRRLPLEGGCLEASDATSRPATRPRALQNASDVEVILTARLTDRLDPS
jgi:hypothetical protein